MNPDTELEIKSFRSHPKRLRIDPTKKDNGQLLSQNTSGDASKRAIVRLRCT
ncbi:hypothetical protein SCOCK_70175 [Actinacidiphila cocklensis]|uniref:Uncharacterized protein n=1 Tax=Actinacidiphila cocklensis TaxID=887465 RepID=A0A9W4EBA8_9ACTN|nr:hypothetical protein SCOCK_70175 [Actinacidiphila cocklensis]